MKKILLIAFITATLISCQKSSLSLVKNTWHGHYSKDTVIASSKDSAKMMEFDCPTAQKWEADTTLSYNHGQPQAIPTTWQEIHHGLMVWVGEITEIGPGVWQREYFIYDYKKAS